MFNIYEAVEAYIMGNFTCRHGLKAHEHCYVCDDIRFDKADKTEAQKRKDQPLATGVLDYFPDALLAVAELSRIGNEQHNPGTPLHWDRSKSSDEADALLRHLKDRGTIDLDGVRHSTKVAWRGLALLQKEIEAFRSQK
jgi:hypothetical protein